ncbi:MAG TPA: DUF6777 domain-containing protein [Fimbriimonadaceae bacterium]|nr:DUF6777 domain-containing protein [Fimbriimonadaceae bacterium]
MASAALGQSNPPRNSYLDKRVNSTSELVQQVQTNTAVMDRYRRHFAMTNEEVVTYLSSLRVSKLEKDGVYTVYGVPHASGDFHAHLRLLKKGEPVFVESDGTPVLQLVCGNPLILGPKKPVTPNPVATATGPVEGTREIPVEAPPAVSAVAPTPATPEVGEPVQPVYPTPHSGSNPVAMLLGLAGAVGFFPHHHSPPPVPEPVSVVVLAGGLAALALRRRARKA